MVRYGTGISIPSSSNRFLMRKFISLCIFIAFNGSAVQTYERRSIEYSLNFKNNTSTRSKLFSFSFLVLPSIENG